MRIVSYEITPVRAGPNGAELRVILHVEGGADGFEVRGVLHGPRCEGIQTIEIGHPIRAGIVWIAEPVSATSDRPYHYAGVAELWSGGEKSDEVAITVQFKGRR